MSEEMTKSTRRAFFLRGGAALGTGVAATVSASAPGSAEQASQQPLQELQGELDRVRERVAIRQLQLEFAACIEQQAYERAVELFDEHANLNLSGATASGRDAIRQMFERLYRGQAAPVLHSAYRQSAVQQSDENLAFDDDRTEAAATFHVDVQLSRPLHEDCTVAQMARLQGHVAERRWETGRLEGRYVKREGVWKISSLQYRAAT
jgi:hypothetical protein